MKSCDTCNNRMRSVLEVTTKRPQRFRCKATKDIMLSAVTGDCEYWEETPKPKTVEELEAEAVAAVATPSEPK